MNARLLVLAAVLGGSTALAGCSTMGGNVKGSFSCVAPDGICAPSATIDDSALAMISGEDGDRVITPAGPYTAPPKEVRGYQSASATPARTRERVLRIVFPAQIDAAGRLHEQSAVHAVVEQGDWRPSLAENRVAVTPDDVAEATSGSTLLAAVERADPPIVDTAEADPDMPSAEAVAAARASRKPDQAGSDPIGDIKDQVARRLAVRPTRTRVSQIAPTAPAAPVAKVGASETKDAGEAAPVAAIPVMSAASLRASRPAAGAKTTIAVPAHVTPAGRAAIASVSANPAIRLELDRAGPEARAAASADAAPTMRAPSFPGVDQ